MPDDLLQGCLILRVPGLHGAQRKRLIGRFRRLDFANQFFSFFRYEDLLHSRQFSIGFFAKGLKFSFIRGIAGEVVFAYRSGFFNNMSG